jgi:hypothetical protein
MFLAILAFTRDTGEYFNLLSGNSNSTARSKTGSVFASERSEAERTLKSELFDPLKRSGTTDASFLALLAAAQKLIMLGRLGTREEVENYLVIICKARISTDAFLNPSSNQLTQSRRFLSLKQSRSSLLVGYSENPLSSREKAVRQCPSAVVRKVMSPTPILRIAEKGMYDIQRQKAGC